MFRNLFSNSNNLSALLQGPYMDARALYAVLFNAVPSVTSIGELDTGQVFGYFDSHYIGNIKTVYQHACYNHSSQQLEASNTLIVLNSKRLVELGPDYVQILHQPAHYHWAHSLVAGLSHFRVAPHERVIGFARPASAN